MSLLLPRVLVVEDDVAIRSMLAAALRRHPLHVDVASDGVEALAQFARAEYAVVVADLMMPRMNGYAFIDALQRVPLRARPVVFVMTAFDESALRDLDPYWVHGCFRKPFDLDHVVEVVHDCAALLVQSATDSPPAVVRETLPSAC